MENVNTSCFTSYSEFLDPKKKEEIESWLEDSRIVNSLDMSDEIEYFDTFSTLEELKYHKWPLKYPKPSWDTTSIIDHHLGELVFGKPFARKTGLVYDRKEGTITFKKDNEKITFKMPHKMEVFNHMDSKDVNTDTIPPFVLENNNDRRNTYYSDSLTLGPEYREDESISKEIRHLMKLEREARRHKGEDYRVVHRMVNPVNAINPTAARGACFECGGTDHFKATCPRGAFMQGAEEARQDPNIMMSIESSKLGFSYEIEIASRHIREIDKVIRGCELEIEGHTFDIDLIPFGSKSFDVIVGMDWLSKHKADIICHEKVVRIPLRNSKTLRVIGEGPEENVRHLRNDNLIYSRNREEHEMHLGLVLELLKKEKLYTKFSKCEFWLQEVLFLRHVINGDGIHVDPSKIKAFRNLEALRTPYEVHSFLGKVIAYASRLLKIHEKNYTTRDLELGAVMFALKIRRHYLYETKSIIYTDHKSLQHMLNQKQLNMHQHRWIELFSDYDCEIRYHPGKANVVADALRLDELIERRSDGSLYYLDRIWVPLKGDVRTLIMDEAHKSKYSVRPGAEEMYYDFRDMYWWPGMKKDIAMYVIVDRLTKSAHFLSIHEDYKMDRSARLYLNEIVPRHEALGTRLDISSAYHPQTDDQSERTIQTLEDMLKAFVFDFEGSWDVHLPLVKFSYNNSYHSSLRCVPFEALYGRKCCSPIMWAEVGEGQLIRTELVQKTTEKISRIKKGMVRFGKKGKLAPRFVGPFEITERIDPVAYRLRLLEELNGIHDTFHVSNLKKCLADPTLQIPLYEIRVDAKLNFMEELVEILEKEFEKLKRSRIAIVKFCLSNYRVDDGESMLILVILVICACVNPF
nr:hypothetical protein [Tanacetum cinerariifolium]